MFIQHFESCPNFVLIFLLADLRGVTTPKMTVLNYFIDLILFLMHHYLQKNEPEKDKR